MKTFAQELYSTAGLIRQRAEAPGLDRLEALRLESLADTLQAEGRIQRRNERDGEARPYITRQLLRRPA